MKYIYAALLLHSASKPIDEANVKKILTAAGADVDESRVKALTAALTEVKIDEVLKEASNVSFAPATQTQAAAPSESKKPAEAKKTEEKKEEEALEGLGALFG